ncbi:MAG: hypothetical protein DMG62_23830 [Acidobacteria bacterium]|nr:MAG: hypothetical protein DMG62_23830 [Acidobacteriota bacterium]
MYFIVAVYKQNKLLLEDAITMEEDNSFEDLLIETLGYITEEKVTLKFFNTLTNHWAGIRDLNTKLIFCKNFEPCQLQFTLNTTESESLEDTRTNINPLERMMENSKRLHLPTKHLFVNRKDLMFNDLIDLLNQKSVGWIIGIHETIGNSFVNKLIDLLWYIDPHHEKIKARGCTIPDIFLTLPQYQINETYNQFYFTGHHKKEQISSEKLETLIKTIESCVSQPWASQNIWKNIIGDIFNLCHIMRKYISYLKNVNERMKFINESDEPVRNIFNNISIETRESLQIINKKYDTISLLLQTSDDYELHFLDNYLPESKKDRYEFINNMKLKVPFTLYRYYHGNYLGTLNFIWKIFDDPAERSKTFEAQAITLANDMIPKFFTRQMKKNIAEKVLLIVILYILIFIYLHINSYSKF